MDIRQKNLRVFEIDIVDENEFFDYINRNLVILRRYLLFIKGLVTVDVFDFLDSTGLFYIDIRDLDITSISGHTKEIKLEPEVHYIKREKLVINKPLRSGEEIMIDDDIVIFSRINSGAVVKVNGNAEIFGIIDGYVEANGNFLILKEINKGEVVFNSESLDKKLFNGIIKKVTFVDGLLDIREL